MQASDTIFALSSGAGKAGIAVIRVSGPQARQALELLASPVPKERIAALRTFRDSRSAVLDQGLAFWFPGPGSATGEDMAEFHCHGSAVAVEAILHVLASTPGLRPAEAGEFTRRSFANGRMDLVEVEGLADLLSARTEAQRKLAIAHVLGQASSVYEGWRTAIITILGRIEAAVDFADEAGVVDAAIAGAGEAARALIAELREAADRFEDARALRDGIKVVLAGPPNAGKSTLLNLLARREAAIVSPIPGTTRDVIEVAMDLGGLPVVLTDTAGLRAKTGETIEAVGMERAQREAEQADILIWVTSPDIENGPTPSALPSIRIRNKSDLESDPLNRERNGELAVSAHTGAGIPAFVDKLSGLIRQRYGRLEHASVIRVRHVQAVRQIIILLEAFLDQDPAHIELAAERLREAATVLGRITGRIDVEDLLDHVFGEFCIGK
jgi:tRNA modification GTPase